MRIPKYSLLITTPQVENFSRILYIAYINNPDIKLDGIYGVLKMLDEDLANSVKYNIKEFYKYDLKNIKVNTPSLPPEFE